MEFFHVALNYFRRSCSTVMSYPLLWVLFCDKNGNLAYNQRFLLQTKYKAGYKIWTWHSGEKSHTMDSTEIPIYFIIYHLASLQRWAQLRIGWWGCFKRPMSHTGRNWFSQRHHLLAKKLRWILQQYWSMTRTKNRIGNSMQLTLKLGPSKVHVDYLLSLFISFSVGQYFPHSFIHSFTH